MSKLERRNLFKFLMVPLLVIILSIPAIALADDWPQFHKDTQHSGYSTDTAPHTNNLLWQSIDIGAVDASSVAVADGKVFVNCGDSIKALNETTGAELWSQTIVDGDAWGSWAGPAYDDGKVFVSGEYIYAFDSATGTPLWAYDIPNDACNGGPMAVNGKVYAGDWDGHHYYCLDANSTDPNGTMLWSLDVGSAYAQGVPAYYDDVGDGRIYLTGWSYPGGHLWCVNAITGAIIWEGSSALDMCGSAMIAAGKVWVTTYNFNDWGEIMAFDINDLGSDGVGDLVWGPVTIERTDSTPVYHNGKVYVGGGCFGYSNEGERTYRIDVATETIDWQTPVALGVGNWTCSVAVADGLVFTGKPINAGGQMVSDYQGIYALNAATGAEGWHYDHGGASPAIANGKVFTVGEGKVWAFEDASYPAWDVNQDGTTNYLDMILIGNHYGESGISGWIPEDVNSDGTVNYLDMILIGNHYGE